MSLKMKWYDKVETLFISMASYIEIRNRIRIQMDHYFVYCFPSIVPIVKRITVLISDWLKRLRWIRFKLSQMVKIYILYLAAVA